MASILNQDLLNAKAQLESGIDINSKGIQSWTPLHCAAFVGNIEIMKLLLKDMLIFLNEKND